MSRWPAPSFRRLRGESAGHAEDLVAAEGLGLVEGEVGPGEEFGGGRDGVLGDATPTPTLTVTRNDSPRSGAIVAEASRSRNRSAVFKAPARPQCGAITTNSSPP